MSQATAERPTRAKKGQPLPERLQVSDDAPDLDAILGHNWRRLEWRLDNLYWIVDKAGQKVRFVMEDEQRDFIRNLHTRNIILKARQLGFSTLVELLQLDQALFNGHHTGVVIADTLPNAGKLFGKIEFGIKHLPPALAEALPVKARTAKTAVEFEHNSGIYVSTSPRGGTVQLLHVSEFGKIARKFPERAIEIVSGGFESVPQDGIIIVESTAEGAAGEFYDIAAPAMKRAEEGAPETALDWRLHFYPWYGKQEYRLSLEDTPKVAISDQDRQYFDKMQQECRTVIDPAQRAWYIKKRETQGRAMKREYPSTPQEAFEQATEGAIFGEEMTTVREMGRITVVPLDPNYRVNTFWDFGLGSRNPIWLQQRIGLQNRWVHYFDDFGKGLGWWWRHLEAWRMAHGEFMWGTHYLPHDADAEILGESVTTKHRILEEAGMRNIVVVPRVAEKSIGIDLMRQKLPADNWFDRIGCAEGIKTLDGYQWEWNEKRGMWSREPLANWAAHGTDAWMQFAQGYEPAVDRADRSWRQFSQRKRSGL